MNPCDYKVYGWEMTLHFRDGTEAPYHRVARTATRARRLAMLRPNVVEVTGLRPLTKTQYISSLGKGRM